MGIQASHEDWFAWRTILAQGWKAKKQAGIYRYRKHADGASRKKEWNENPHFHLRALAHESVTIFTALSGRTRCWPRFADFLERQTWPHEQCRLFFLDTSQNPDFGRTVRQWLLASEYGSVRYEQMAVGAPGLADAERFCRLEVVEAVRLAAARIYNHLAREVSGGFVLVIEDDVIPPANVVELLLRAFDNNTASVAAPYPSRYHEGFVAWRAGHEIITARGQGVETIEGNGFGCVLLRTAALKDVVFTCRQGPHLDFDPMFYERLKATGRTAKLCWPAEAEHIGAPVPQDVSKVA